MPQAATVSDPKFPCLVICPFHDTQNPDRAYIRWKSAYLIEKVIRPVTSEFGYHAATMEERFNGDWIPEALALRLSKDALSVAILESMDPAQNEIGAYSDTSNANVIYEIGLRHAWCRPTIVLCPERKISKLPFDLRDLHAIQYPAFQRHTENPSVGVEWSNEAIESLREELRQRVTSMISDGASSHLEHRFNKALLVHQERFGMAMVLEMKRELLAAVRDTLESFECDVLADYDWSRHDSEARQKLADVISQPQKLLLSQVSIYRRISEGRLKSMQSGKFALALCRKLSEIARSMAQLVSVLRTPQPESFPSKESVLERIGKLKDDVEAANELGEKLLKECYF